MNSKLYKHCCEMLEGHFQRPFGTTETRNRALNAVWENVKNLSDADLELAVDRLVMTNRQLPTPMEYQAMIVTIGDQRQRTQTADIERDADQYRKEAAKHDNILTSPPLGQMGKDGIRLLRLWQFGYLTLAGYAEECDKLDALYPGVGWHKAGQDFKAKFLHKGLDYCCPPHASID